MTPKDYNFGRVVYVTLQPAEFDSTDKSVNAADPKAITLVYDPTENINFCSRIGFWIRPTQSDGDGPGMKIATIDLYNVGPAIRQFLNAYNEFDNIGLWRADHITRYKVALQVGHKSKGKAARFTIFSGWINSFNVERQQTESTVDNIWHLYCQDIIDMPQPKKVDIISDAEQRKRAILQARKTYLSGDLYIREIIMAQPRSVLAPTPTTIVSGESSFTVNSEASGESTLVSLPTVTMPITPANINQYYEIRYVQPYQYDEPDETLRQEFEETAFVSFPLDTSSLPQALIEVAGIRRCHAEVRPDPMRGKIFIYIYRAGKPTVNSVTKKKEPWVITNFQNLLTPPTIGGKMLRLDLLLEPRMLVQDSVELKIDKDFLAHNVPSFGLDLGGKEHFLPQAAGSNVGLAYNVADPDHLDAMKEFGNIFNRQYKILVLEHQGDTHTNQWSTRIQCIPVGNATRGNK